MLVQYWQYHPCQYMVPSNTTNVPFMNEAIVRDLIETKLHLVYQAMLARKPDPVDGDEPTYDDALKALSEIIDELT